MRLFHAHIQNFRCVRDLSLTWEGVTVLVGANSTGKSSVLHALRWFFEGGSLTLEDLWGHHPDNVVSVALTFTDFNEEDREALGSYVTEDEATFWRTWSAEDGEKLTGRALAFPPFEEVRRHGKAGEKRSAYKALREGRPELGLSSARSADEAEERMRTWEAEHREELELAGLGHPSLRSGRTRKATRAIRLRPGARCERPGSGDAGRPRHPPPSAGRARRR